MRVFAWCVAPPLPALYIGPEASSSSGSSSPVRPFRRPTSRRRCRPASARSGGAPGPSRSPKSTWRRSCRAGDARGSAGSVLRSRFVCLPPSWVQVSHPVHSPSTVPPSLHPIERRSHEARKGTDRSTQTPSPLLSSGSAYRLEMHLAWQLDTIRLNRSDTASSSIAASASRAWSGAPAGPPPVRVWVPKKDIGGDGVQVRRWKVGGRWRAGRVRCGGAEEGSATFCRREMTTRLLFPVRSHRFPLLRLQASTTWLRFTPHESACSPRAGGKHSPEAHDPRLDEGGADLRFGRLSYFASLELGLGGEVSGGRVDGRVLDLRAGALRISEALDIKLMKELYLAEQMQAYRSTFVSQPVVGSR